MHFIVGLGLLTLVGLLLLARKHQIDLTAAIKSKFVLVAVMLVSGPLLDALGVLIGQSVVVRIFALLSVAAAGAGWLLLIFSLMGVLAPEPYVVSENAPPARPKNSSDSMFDDGEEGISI